MLNSRADNRLADSCILAAGEWRRCSGSELVYRKIHMCADLRRSRGAVEKVKCCMQVIKSLNQHVLQTGLFLVQSCPPTVRKLYASEMVKS